MSARSSSSCSVASRPRTASRSSPFAFATAFVTPLPPYAAPPSRSSTASCTPVEAPDGTAARPTAPDSSSTSTSTVGLPRGSRIWRARTSAILLTGSPWRGRSNGSAARAGELLGNLDPAPESVRGAPELELWIDVELPGDVVRREQHVAELLGAPLRRVEIRFQLAQLVVEVGDSAVDVGVLEPDRLRTPLQLAGIQECRQCLGHMVEDALASLLLPLDAVPVLLHASGCVGVD